MHETVADLSGRLLSEARRRNYVTPTPFLELINTYKTLLGKKRERVNLLIKRYNGGLGALQDAETSVNTMAEEQLALQPGLVQAKEDTEVFSGKVEAKVPEVGCETRVTNVRASAYHGTQSTEKSEHVIDTDGGNDISSAGRRMMMGMARTG
eukprot:1152578-Rhodomonas_salina.1